MTLCQTNGKITSVVVLNVDLRGINGIFFLYSLYFETSSHFSFLRGWLGLRDVYVSASFEPCNNGAIL